VPELQQNKNSMRKKKENEKRKNKNKKERIKVLGDLNLLEIHLHIWTENLEMQPGQLVEEHIGNVVWQKTSELGNQKIQRVNHGKISENNHLQYC
jgi:hypothetical protein